MIWSRCLEADRAGHVADIANAVRYAQNASKEQFSQFMGSLIDKASA